MFSQSFLPNNLLDNLNDDESSNQIRPIGLNIIIIIIEINVWFQLSIAIIISSMSNNLSVRTNAHTRILIAKRVLFQVGCECAKRKKKSGWLFYNTFLQFSTKHTHTPNFAFTCSKNLLVYFSYTCFLDYLSNCIDYTLINDSIYMYIYFLCVYWYISVFVYFVST